MVRGLPDVATIMEDKVPFLPIPCLCALEDPIRVMTEWSAVDSIAKSDRLPERLDLPQLAK